MIFQDRGADREGFRPFQLEAWQLTRCQYTQRGYPEECRGRTGVIC